LDVTPAEESQLLRATIESVDDTKPGWFWFRDMAEEAMPGLLFGLAEGDGSEDVRSRALDLLRTAQVKIPQEWWPSLPLGDDSLRVREPASRT
jgi:hypothetical protein